jgi:hypothetical protein
MRLGPDLSQFGDELPDLEELLPEEVQYLCDVCRMLTTMGICGRGAPIKPDPDFEPFDPDELGMDPEKDRRFW